MQDLVCGYLTNSRASAHDSGVKTTEAIEAILNRDRVLAVRDHRSWACTLGRLVAKGVLVRVLPGVYAAKHLADDVWTKCLALLAKDPDAVITGQAALVLQAESARTVPVIEFVSRRRLAAGRGFRRIAAAVPPEMIVQQGPIRCARQIWAAVERAATDDGASIDDVLRRTRAVASDLREVMAVFGKRRGNTTRRAVVTDSRDTPWSYAERRAHRILRAAGITGWVTNLPVNCGGNAFYLDLAFPDLHLAIEIDGFTFHSSHDSFQADRARQNLLVAEGWTVLHFTWEMLDDPQAVLSVITDTIARLRRMQRLLGRRAARAA